MTFSIVDDVHGIGHFPHVRHRVSCIYYGITPSRPSLVPFALSYLIVALSTTYDNHVIYMHLRSFVSGRRCTLADPPAWIFGLSGPRKRPNCPTPKQYL